jgi:hypothetical protein
VFPLVLFLVALLSCAPAYAQSGAAEVRGRVTAAEGEGIDGADVTLTNIDTGVERKARSDEQGRFGFPGVPAGRYQVTAAHAGFATRRQDDIDLVPGTRIQLDLPLRSADRD